MPLAQVADQSYALTLWLLWHAEQRDYVAGVARQDARFDLAGLVAHAFNSPAELPKMRERFIADTLEVDEAAVREVARRRIRVHRKLRPVDPGPT
jgi:ribose 1,5-bisphosphokinase PhnN